MNSITTILIILCSGIFAAIQLMPSLFDVFKNNEQLHWLTYSVVHVTPVHFAFNIIGMFCFGGMVERNFTRFITASVFIMGALTGWLFNAILFPDIILIGASAGIYAWLAFYCWEDLPLYLFALIKVPALLLLAALAGYEFYALLFTDGGIISHASHLGGITAGILAAEIYSRIDKNTEVANGLT